MNLAVLALVASAGAAVAMGILVWKTASAHVWRLNAEGQEKRAIEAERRETAALTELAEARVVIERLEKIPDLAKLVKLMGDQYERTERRSIERTAQLAALIQTHEVRAVERHRAVLEAIAA